MVTAASPASCSSSVSPSSWVCFHRSYYLGTMVVTLSIKAIVSTHGRSALMNTRTAKLDTLRLVDITDGQISTLWIRTLENYIFNFATRASSIGTPSPYPIKLCHDLSLSYSSFQSLRRARELSNGTGPNTPFAIIGFRDTTNDTCVESLMFTGRYHH